MTVYFKPDEFGGRIQMLRKRQGDSQKRMSRALDVSDDYIGKVERGVLVPSPEMLIAIADYLKVSTDYLLIGREYEPLAARERLLELMEEAIRILLAQ